MNDLEVSLLRIGEFKNDGEISSEDSDGHVPVELLEQRDRFHAVIILLCD